jgi:hypothetical protein
MLFLTCVSWISSLEQSKIQEEGKTYLLRAQVQMREDQDFTRLDKIRFSEFGDRFDPFMDATVNPKNSYIGDSSYLNFGGPLSQKGGNVVSKKSGLLPG